MKYIESSYPVPNIETQTLHEKLVYSNSGLVLFDTRLLEEFEQSHIKDSIWIDPETKPEDFLSDQKTQIENQILIFYCSVGQRSSQFIQNVQDLCLDNGAGGLYNLRGGIFKWYNEGFPVYNESGATNEIHPYNEFWGHFLEPRKA
jgi:rhodanese-related sulfurtransferase